jgi:hypothetical protein
MTTFTTEDRLEALRSIEGDDEIQHAQTQEPQPNEADNEPQSFWNHRVVLMPDDGLGNQWYEVQEVYYNRKGEPCGYCNSYVGGETMAELEEQIERHKKALTLPMLDSATAFNNKWEDDYEKEY